MARIKARSGRVFAQTGFGDASLPPVSQCSVDTITKSGGDTWGKYCDCMFTAPGTEDQYFINGVRQYPIGVTAAAQIAAWSKQPGFSIKTITTQERSADWYKCVMKFCANTGGCDDPVTKVHSNFNVNPSIGLAPWTELGASARGIPKRNAGFWYDVGTVFNIDASEYEPVKLWVTYWNNPAKFLLLAAKASLFPGAAIYTAALSAGQIAFMYPYVMAEVQLKGLDWKKNVLDPMGKGWIKFGKLLISYVAKCGIGIPGACGAGVLLRQVAQDQIDDGTINGIQDPAIKATIVFLAQYGDVLADRIYAAIKNIGKIAKDPSIWGWLSSVFLSLSKVPLSDFFNKTDKKAQKDVASLKLFFVLGSKVFAMASVIATGLSQDRPITTVVDDAVAALIGFRPSDIQSLWAQGAAGAKSAGTIITNAEQREGMTLDQMGKLAQALGVALSAVISAMNQINSKVGGGITDLIKELQATADVFSTVTQTTSNVVTNLAQQTGHTSTPTKTTTPIAKQATKAAGPGFTIPYTPIHLKRSPVELAAPLVLAAGGFAVGGPIGAAVAGAVGYFFTRPGASTSIAGYGGVTAADVNGSGIVCPPGHVAIRTGKGYRCARMRQPLNKRRVVNLSAFGLTAPPPHSAVPASAGGGGGVMMLNRPAGNAQVIGSGIQGGGMLAARGTLTMRVQQITGVRLMPGGALNTNNVSPGASSTAGGGAIPVTPPPPVYPPDPTPSVVSVTQATGTQVTDAGVTSSPDDNEFTQDYTDTSGMDPTAGAGYYTDPMGNQYIDQGNGYYADGNGAQYTLDQDGYAVPLPTEATPPPQSWDDQVTNAQSIVAGANIAIDPSTGMVIPSGMSVTPIGGGQQMFVPPPPPAPGITPGKVLVGAGLVLGALLIFSK